MAEYIACRRCNSPDCKGCNLKRLETMLENGKFDCLMNENRSINTSSDVALVRHGKWLHTEIEDDEEWGGIWHKWTCDNCGYSVGNNPNGTNYCPNCGAKMDGGAD